MCSDSYWSDGAEVGRMRKVHRVRGELVGLAGGVADIALWLEAWQLAPMAVHRGELKNNGATVLLLNDHGLLTWEATNGWTPIEQHQFAIGSGGVAARAALAAGATCSRAVAIAKTIDAGTRGPVRLYRLKAY